MFDKYLQSQKLFNKNQNLLLALSGGVDSVVLAQLLTQLKYRVTLAHCNFKLRGKQSDGDEKFCRELAKKLNVKIHVQTFDVKTYCKKNKVSIQMAARELRYGWFEQLLKEQHYDLLLTAHHADDSVETVLLNLIRGSGLKGLTGMQEQNKHIIRPLLTFSKKEILLYAKKHKINFRKDSSNDDDKYKRNFVRLKLLPQILKLNPSFESTLLRNAQNIHEDLNLLNEFVQLKKQNLLLEKNGQIVIEIKQLLKEQNVLAISKHLLSEYGFNATQVQNLITSLNSKTLSGKLIKSKSHILYVNSNALTIVKNEKMKSFFTTFNSMEALSHSKLFDLKSQTKFSLPKANQFLVEPQRLIFPLILRSRKTGDKFKPFGMQGFKLLSDFYKEQKLNAIQKQNVKLLVNGNGEIMWVIGFRSDERYRITEKFKNILIITCFDN